ncbi:hypothetical protein QJS04_geneDACA012031 [Acorus gramineus]|uniref:Neprosin PEP catalytic domain-containing protein n=1 Tax=Acorus gramineus TaxID=55184 RepID=A0AAV9BDP8_ACOGR|nr:hypothetical protein QJS04_geneDACA012031 [Acorus gramineus]
MPKNHSSAVFAILVNGKKEYVIALQAGWAVSPSTYGDDRTHFTIAWTTDGYNKEGCINLLCPGFVQVGRYFTPGFAFRPFELSIYNGRQQVLPIVISKDKKTGNWWLMIGPKITPVGYWPNSLVKGLANGAESIIMGGIADAPENEPSPPMGSGHFPSEGWRKASRFQAVQYLDENNEFQTPVIDDVMADDLNCYDVGEPFKDPIGKTFYFGGSGGDYC